MSYELKALSKEEYEAFVKEMDALAEKHNVEIGIQSVLQVTKRVEKAPESDFPIEAPIESPYVPDSPKTD